MSLTVNIKNLTVHVPPPGSLLPQGHFKGDRLVVGIVARDIAAGAPVAAGAARTAGVDVQATVETRAPAIASHTRVCADGRHLPPEDTTTPHVAVIDHNTGLMWSVESLGKPSEEDEGLSQQECAKRCAELRLLGFDDWRLPTRAELVTLIDDTRHDPAIDTALFPRVKPRWHWTSTPTAWSSSAAWLVDFGYGGVSGSHRDGVGFALAVRRAGQ